MRYLTRGVFMVSKALAILVFALVGVFGGASIGCSKAGDTLLSGPEKPSPPEKDSVGPGSSNENSGEENSSNETGSNSPTPAPSPPIVLKKYRLFCDDRYPPYLSSVSSMASSMGFGAGLYVGVPNRDGSFDPLGKPNLEDHRSPQILRLPAFGEAKILFSAKPLTGNRARRIFVADTDVATRSGRALDVAREVAPDSSFEAKALREGLKLRTFGVSDGGKYLLIGTPSGYDFVDAVTLRKVGSVQAGSASRNVNPELRESDMIFSLSQLDGGFVQTTLRSLSTDSSGAIRSSNVLATVKGLRRPLVSVSPAAGESFAAVDSADKIRTVRLSSGAPRVFSLAISNLPKKGQLSSAAAFWRDAVTKEPMAFVGFENIDRDATSGVSGRYKIVQVFVRVLSLDESKLSAMTEAEFDYPMEAKRVIESGVGGPRSLSELRSSPDGLEIFALFPGGLSSEIYRFKAQGFERVSQEACGEFSLGVEP